MERSELNDALDGAVYDAVFTQEDMSPGAFILERLKAAGFSVVPIERPRITMPAQWGEKV